MYVCVLYTTLEQIFYPRKQVWLDEINGNKIFDIDCTTTLLYPLLYHSTAQHQQHPCIQRATFKSHPSKVTSVLKPRALLRQRSWELFLSCIPFSLSTNWHSTIQCCTKLCMYTRYVGIESIRMGGVVRRGEIYAYIYCIPDAIQISIFVRRFCRHIRMYANIRTHINIYRLIKPYI